MSIKITKIISIILSVIVIVFVGYVFVVGERLDYTDRARTVLLITSTLEIAEAIEKGPEELDVGKIESRIPHNIEVKSESGETIEISYRDVSPDGVLRLFSPQLGVLIVFTPILEEGKVKWSCWGSPAKMVPSECRKNS